MTQYRFTTRNLSVLYGWDDPLQYHFLVITKQKSEGGRSVKVFSNLDLTNPAMTIAQIQQTLAAHGMDIPADLEENLRRDEALARKPTTPRPLQAMIADVLGRRPTARQRSSFKLRVNPDLVEEMKGKSDATEFGTVKAYVRNPSSEIRFVWVIRGDLALEDVAAWAREKTETTEREFWEMIDRGLLEIAWDMPFTGQPHMFSLDSIPDARYCEVIYLPPTYLVRFCDDDDAVQP